MVGVFVFAVGNSSANPAAAEIMNRFKPFGINTIEQIIALNSSATISSIILVLLGIYLGKRAIKYEENNLNYLRTMYLKLNCFFTTQFSYAILEKVDFSNTDLKFIRFQNAKFVKCHLNRSNNLHLALTNGTSLESRKVRNLVIDGLVSDKNFALLDLRGLDFSRLELQDFDFSHANLCGADLSYTNMTGTTLEGWNIDTETVLDDIDCKYYFYLEDGEKKRMPPEVEEYQPGEFTRIFQKIANTIDFIAHSETELAAIKLSVEHVRVQSGNDDIRVQAIEEKDGFIVVKVTVPKTEDRGVLYHEVNSLKQEYETKIQLLLTEKHADISGLKRSIEFLNREIKEQRQAFLTAIKEQNVLKIDYVKELTMGNTITNNFTGSTINNNGVMNLGEIIGNVSQMIQQLPDDQVGLKQLLNQLTALIAESSLHPSDQKDALEETLNIAAASQQPNEENNNRIRKALIYLKGLAGSLEAPTETAEKIISVILKIGGLFGI